MEHPSCPCGVPMEIAAEWHKRTDHFCVHHRWCSPCSPGNLSAMVYDFEQYLIGYIEKQAGDQ